LFVGIFMILACGPQTDQWGDSAAQSTDFPPTWAGVQTLLSAHCDTCHDGSNQFELRSAIEEDLERETRLLVVPGDPAGSVLWDAVAGTTLTRMMPPSGRLPEADVQHVSEWIETGARVE
jgi:hypothetical protein